MHFSADDDLTSIQLLLLIEANRFIKDDKNLTNIILENLLLQQRNDFVFRINFLNVSPFLLTNRSILGKFM